MGSNPINLAVRFILELIALGAMALWGWKLSDNWMRLLLAIGIPLTAMLIWGTFAIPEDPSRSGEAPIPVSGMTRLLIEFSFFGFAIWIFHDLGMSRVGMWMGLCTIVHYAVSYDRILWMLAKG